MSKGQGISINVIIIAAIALLVLVVLSVMFIGRIGLFGVKSVSCTEQGGTCSVDVCPAGTREYTPWRCPDTPEGAKQRCCVAIGV
ncbi:MAG: hypothetical protein QXU88_00910 [Candidatus Woesearchaeota archaeon]